jgi:hypothetical protein
MSRGRHHGFGVQRFGVVFAIAQLLVAQPLFAEQPAKADVSEARRLFDEATALERQSSWREASVKLDAALAIKETPGLHFHRAHCAEQLGDLVVAARHYARAEALIRAGAAAPDVEELLAAAQVRVLARVPRLVLSLPADAKGATLEIDGVAIRDEPGTPLFLEPGRHRIVARAPGRRDFAIEINLVEGQTQTLEVALSPPPHRKSAATVREAETKSDTGSWGAREIVLIGEATLTVAGLATGIGYSIAMNDADDRYEGAQQSIDATLPEDPNTVCLSNPPPACAELEDAGTDRQRAARFATIGFVTAGVGAAATFATWALWPSSRDHVSAAVAPSMGGATLSLSGRF